MDFRTKHAHLWDCFFEGQKLDYRGDNKTFWGWVERLGFDPRSLRIFSIQVLLCISISGGLSTESISPPQQYFERSHV